MSTRSGKRIHGSLDEDPMEVKLSKKEIRKLNQHAKENVSKCNKKNAAEQRKHYVRYPSEEEIRDKANIKEEQSGVRKSKRHTLKDRSNEVIIQNDDQLPMKRTRKTKIGKEGSGNDVQPNNRKKIKKNKIKSLEFKDGEEKAKKKSMKKKQKQKMRKSGSSNVNAVPDHIENCNTSHASVDSFHSAAGSPTNEIINGIEETALNAQDENVDKNKTNHTDTDVDMQKSNSHKTKLRRSKITLAEDIRLNDCINNISKHNEKLDHNEFLNNTYDKIGNDDENCQTSHVITKKKSILRSFNTPATISKDENPSYLSPLKTLSVTDEINDAYDKMEGTPDTKCNTTFDKSTSKSIIENSDVTNEKLPNNSLISSDCNTFESNEIINCTSNISDTLNVTENDPIVIESSLDESKLVETSIKQAQLKREGTFTKDCPEVPMTPIINPEKTPIRRKSLPSPGCTPFPLSNSKSNEKRILNLTHSIEKRRSSLAEYASRTTKVMFCSPVNNPGVTSQIKKKVIKSNLKGSNKSFVFEDSDCRLSGRKRSRTQCDAEQARAKRKRLADDLQESVDRLSRPRTTSATAKLQDIQATKKNVTPKIGTPSKQKDAKVLRTKLPNFAVLHQKRFEKMESLDECQERKANRARQLLTPTGPFNMERISPKENNPTGQLEKPKKTETLINEKLESTTPAYTRFGFKLKLDGDPFKFSATNTALKPKAHKESSLKRQNTLPSLNGGTISRRDFAKQTVMREKSFTDRNAKRTESRTIIKGVRTNRRFDLQMKMRNIVQS